MGIGVMRALWLDYQQPAPGRGMPGVILLAVSLLAAGWLLANYFAVVGTLDDATQEVSRLKRAAASQLPTGTIAPAAQSADRWESLFASLESAGDDSVTLLALKPGRTEITITGEAKDMDASMEYVKRLQSATVFANIHVTQSELVAEHPQRPIRFTLASAWQGAAP
jgi:Tfp pilus assembly protein PilN